jgi:hypothetical protein
MIGYLNFSGSSWKCLKNQLDFVLAEGRCRPEHHVTGAVRDYKGWSSSDIVDLGTNLALGLIDVQTYRVEMFFKSNPGDKLFK